MMIIISLMITLVLVGVPTWLIVRNVKKSDESTVVHSPEEVTKRLRKGFYLSNWGIELAFGGILSFAIIFCDVPEVFQSIIPMVMVTCGLIVFFVGRMQVGMMTRYLHFCNRERTELEEWVLKAMQGIESAAMKRSRINAITKVTPGVADDMLSAMNSKGVISGYQAVGKVYIGKNIFKNHWPLISIIVLVLFCIVITIIK